MSSSGSGPNKRREHFGEGCNFSYFLGELRETVEFLRATRKVVSSFGMGSNLQLQFGSMGIRNLELFFFLDFIRSWDPFL